MARKEAYMSICRLMLLFVNFYALPLLALSRKKISYVNGVMPHNGLKAKYLRLVRM